MKSESLRSVAMMTLLLLCGTVYSVLGQATTDCGSLLETFDAPFGGNGCAGTTGPTATCHSRYTHSMPYVGAWVDPVSRPLPLPSPDVAEASFTVKTLPGLTTNWLVVKPLSEANTYFQIPDGMIGTGGQTNVAHTQYNRLWTKTLSLPAGYGGRFTVDVPGSPSQLSAQYRSIRCTASGSIYNNVVPQIIAVPGRAGESRLVFDLPDGSFASGPTTLSLTAPQSITPSFIRYREKNSSDDSQYTASTQQVSTVPYYYLDNIAFQSSAPDFVETFDPSFVDCTLPPGGLLSQDCHSRYTHSMPYVGAWVDPVSRPLPLPSPDVAEASFTVKTLPGLTTNWLVVKPLSEANTYFQIPDGMIGTGGQTNVAHTQYNRLWTKTLSLPAGYGGRFTVDVPGSPSQLSAQYRSIRCTASGSIYNNVVPQIIAVPGRAGESRLVFDLPDGSFASGPTTLSLTAPQSITPSFIRYREKNSSDDSQYTASTQQVSTVPYYYLDNIAFQSNGPFAPLPLPTVANISICAPGGSAQLTVAPTQLGVKYDWYDSPTATEPFATATTSSPTITITVDGSNTIGGLKTYYVQAVPAGALGCPSDYLPVTVRLQSVTVPAVTVPASVVLGNTLNLSFIGQPNYTYVWDWGDNTTSTTTGTATAITHLYVPAVSPTTYNVTLTIRDGLIPTPCEAVVRYSVIVSDKLCETVLPAVDLSAVKVRRDPRTGAYQFELPGCTTPTVRLFDCLTGQGTAQPEVVAASAIALAVPAAQPAPTYRLDAAALAENPFLAGARRLRPQATYAYSTPVEATATKSYEVGRFALTPFNWTSSAQHRLPAWQPGGQATRFSPDGEAVEEQDLLGIYSCVQLGYRAHALPYLTAKNARFSQVLFEGCETMYAAPRPDEYGRLVAALTGENGYAVAATEARLETGYAHSGTQCLALTSRAGVSTLTLPAFAARDFAQPLQLKLWLRVSHAATPAKALGRATVLAGQVGATPVLAVAWASGQSTPARVVAQSGEWLLCEATSPPGLATAGPTSYAPQLVCTGPAERQLWVDDVRLQPAQAQMSCYVYEPATFRLLASFDDQHFGLYYQYNAEGKLVRKQVETERGLQTIQETQYNAPNP